MKKTHENNPAIVAISTPVLISSVCCFKKRLFTIGKLYALLSQINLNILNNIVGLKVLDIVEKLEFVSSFSQKFANKYFFWSACKFDVLSN